MKKKINQNQDKNAILYEEKKNALKKCDPIERIKDKVISFEVHDNYKGAIEYLESIKPRLPEPLHEDYGWAIHKFIQELDFKESAQLIKSYLLKDSSFDKMLIIYLRYISFIYVDEVIKYLEGEIKNVR